MRWSRSMGVLVGVAVGRGVAVAVGVGVGVLVAVAVGVGVAVPSACTSVQPEMRTSSTSKAARAFIRRDALEARGDTRYRRSIGSILILSYSRFAAECDTGVPR